MPDGATTKRHALVPERDVIAFPTTEQRLQLRRGSRVLLVQSADEDDEACLQVNLERPECWFRVRAATGKRLVNEGFLRTSASDSPSSTTPTAVHVVGHAWFAAATAAVLAPARPATVVSHAELAHLQGGALVIGCYAFRDGELIDWVTRTCVERGLCHLPMVMDVDSHWVGPLYNGGNACQRCVEIRVQACSGRLAELTEYWDFLREQGPDYRLPGVQDAEGSLLAALAGRLLERSSSGRADRGDFVLEYDRMTLQVSRRPVLKVPGCPVCGG